MKITGNQHTHDGRRRPLTNWLHPRVYGILIALTAWFALAVWNFAGGGGTDYLLFIVSGFIFVAVMLPAILSRVGHNDPGHNVNESAKEHTKEPSLHDWAACDYDTWTGPLSGAAAATQILLPIAAAAVGMTLIGIIFRIAEHSAV
ncbi:MAG: hypothetical protein WB760_06465 [Xanthobacteraceae bacterium]